jgi:predicted HicB family RNase H-like nuclease
MGKRGRKPSQFSKSKQLAVRVSQATYDAVIKRAAELNISMADFVRLAIEEHSQRLNA